jgi:hypothetical protein
MKLTMEQALARNVASHDIIWKQLVGASFPNTVRSSLVLAYFALALEHQQAISKLVEAKLFGPAFALMRVQLEAEFRGMWVNLIATHVQVSCIADHGDKPFPEFRAMAKALDSAYLAQGWLKSFVNQWAALNGYTHSGLEQLANRFQADGNLGPCYPDALISDLLVLSSTTAIGTIIPILRQFKFNDRAEILEKWIADNLTLSPPSPQA